MKRQRKIQLAKQFCSYLSRYLRKGKTPTEITITIQSKGSSGGMTFWRSKQEIKVPKSIPNDNFYYLLWNVARCAVKMNLPPRARWSVVGEQAQEHLEIWVIRKLEKAHKDMPPFSLAEMRDKTGCGILADWLEEQGSEWAELVRYLSRRLPGVIG